MVPARSLRTRSRGVFSADRAISRTRWGSASCGSSAGAPSISATICSSAPGSIVTIAHGLAVAQDRRPVAQGGDLEQTVGDEDHRAAGLALARDHIQDLLRQIRRQGGGHLVEQQYLGLDGERAGEIQDAQHRERQVARHLEQVERGHAELGHPVHERLDRGLGEAEVGGDVEVGDQRRLLIDRDQPGAARLGRRVHRARLAAHQDPPGVGPHHAGQDFTRVDLPAPLAPSSAWTSPGRTASDASRSAATAP